MENIIIPNPTRLEKIKENFRGLNSSQIQVVSDFDCTLTTNLIEGRRAPSLVGILREGNYLGADYSAKAQALSDHYRPIEVDPLIPLEEKKIAMETWWQKHFDLLIASNLNKADMEKAIKQSGLQLRSGAEEFFNFLQQKNIPLVIFSASGLGQEGIELMLQEQKLLLDNVYLVANSFVWDDRGRALKVQEPIIHSFNKDEAVLQNFPFFLKRLRIDPILFYWEIV